MLTFFILVSLIIGEICAVDLAIDTASFDRFYQNPDLRTTNQFNEPCIKFKSGPGVPTHVYCKSPNDDPRKCAEVTSTISGDTGTEIQCTPPVQTQTETQTETQPPQRKPNDNNDDGTCSSEDLCSVQMELIQKITELVSTMSNLHITQTQPGAGPSVTEEKLPEHSTNPDLITTVSTFELLWTVKSGEKIISKDGERCLNIKPYQPSPGHPDPGFLIYCKVEGDDIFAHICQRDTVTNQVTCQSQESLGDAAAVQLRNNDNVYGYKTSNDVDGIQEIMRMQLISMWVVLAVIVIGNAIFIWCYMKRNKQRTFDLE